MVWQSSPSGKGRRRFGGPDAQVARTAGETRPLTQAASPRNLAFILCSMYCAQIHDFIEIRQVYDTYYLYLSIFCLLYKLSYLLVCSHLLGLTSEKDIHVPIHVWNAPINESDSASLLHCRPDGREYMCTLDLVLAWHRTNTANFLKPSL